MPDADSGAAIQRIHDDLCEECGQPLRIDEEWKLKPGLVAGTEMEGSLSENYVHKRCYPPEADD